MKILVGIILFSAFLFGDPIGCKYKEDLVKLENINNKLLFMFDNHCANIYNSVNWNYLKEEDQMPFINLMAEKNYFSKEGIEAAIDWASRKQKTELLSILMNEQHKRFPKKKKTFEL